MGGRKQTTERVALTVIISFCLAAELLQRLEVSQCSEQQDQQQWEAIVAVAAVEQ